ncbi:Chromosome transmission fidelity protein [Coniochaeta hoffmannii]|uniref:Chromosome transmission fidelity protein n=1 Tax=Coniochaeta hoffmannii TaxID=91930 RepID=A0AA38RKR6_9PEZI|nr:Chromosome transmission fidelity protein [Coniochaeta hoffmannii]
MSYFFSKALADEGARPPYVCLSHCWGLRPFLRTLTRTLKAHIDNIPFASLPLTFQEAIDFTRRLGIRYLWIDSLCIIQDDESDWRVEASQMASIYQNCYLVISAAKSSGAYEGLYADFPPRCRTHIVHIDAQDPEDGLISREAVRIRQPLTHSQRSLVVYAPPEEPPPLFTRGWVLQERLLAPRVLHFGPEELSWECRESSACQSLPKSYYSPIAWAALSNPTNRATHLETVWYRLVEDYTRLHLTYEKDVFPALSGFARLLQSATGWTYLAGLWREVLPRALLWNVDRPSPFSGTRRSWPRRPARWRAPSWSWAAVDCPVKFEVHEIDRPDRVEGLCEVVGAGCEPAGPDERGELVEGGSWLVLKGRAVRARMRVREGVEVLPFSVGELDVVDGYMRNFWVDNDGRTASGETGEREVVCLLAGRHTITEALTLLVLEVTEQEEKRDERSMTSAEGGLYRRVGIVSVFDGPVGAPRLGWQNQFLALGEEMLIEII